MTGEKKMFTSFEKNETTSDNITFRDNSQGMILAVVKLLSQYIVAILPSWQPQYIDLVS
jgi:hypothetical protein